RQLVGEAHALGGGARLPHELELRRGREQGRQARAEDRVVLDDEHARHAVPSPAVWPSAGAAGRGNQARTDVPPPPAARVPTSRVPPSSSTRSRMALMPTPWRPAPMPTPSSSTVTETPSDEPVTATRQLAAWACRTTFITPSVTTRYTATSTGGGSASRPPPRSRSRSTIARVSSRSLSSSGLSRPGWSSSAGRRL